MKTRSMGHKEYIRALTIAGSDSGGGAGVQADIRTMSALGVYASSAITAVTAQDTTGVGAIHTLPSEVVYDQVSRVMEDIRPMAVKIGMLPTVTCIDAVCRALAPYYHEVPIVLDPVMTATSGSPLIRKEAIECLRWLIIPKCKIITPNLPEAERLSGIEIKNEADMEKAAYIITEMRSEWVLIKGGHRTGRVMEDVLYDYGLPIKTFRSRKVDTVNTHGTGCTLSSAITAYLAMGHDTVTAVGMAKKYMQMAIKAGADVKTGEGHGPVNHLFAPTRMKIVDVSDEEATHNI